MDGTWSTVWTYLGWGIVPLGLSVYLALSFWSEHRAMFLPGQTTAGHYQIELACQACHTPFAGVKQSACLDCHAAELERANDSHPSSKFTDPRNADRVAILDARLCVTCHREHRPAQTRPVGVTLAMDYCFHCHADLAEERPSHAGLGFATCANAGCHNFHDNTALYEDFLLEHLHEPALLDNPVVPLRAIFQPRPLGRADADGPPPRSPDDQRLFEDWVSTRHAQAGINCTDCHRQPASGASQTSEKIWTDRVGYTVCQSCHQAEAEGFLAGRHGMRLAQQLPPMRPELARQPMKTAAHGRELGCLSCHSAHRFDTRQAAVEACLACHDDAHSRAYTGSAHFRLWQKELSGQLPPGSGVSCATCHLPREIHRQGETDTVRVQHNQNGNLRPNEKMLRSACMQCHGLGFALDALADPELIARNFSGQPAVHVASLDMAERRQAETARTDEQAEEGR